MPTTHTVEVYNPSDELVAILDKAQDLKYNKSLNRPTTLSFSLDVNDPKATADILAGGQNYIKYKRGSQLAWSGEIINYDVALQSDNETISVLCGDWFYLLKDRSITAVRTFSSVNEGTILQTILSEAQALSNGDFGIVNGVNTATATRDRTYKDKNIQQAFVNMSEIINGVDFEITPEKILNIYDKKQIDRTTTHVFEYGVNIASLRFSKDWTQLKNDLKGYGDEGIQRDADDVGSQSTYRRRQSIESFTDVQLQATVDRKLDDILRTNAGPIAGYGLTLLPDSTPLFGTYEVGDLVTVRVSKGIASIDQAVRIYGWNATITNDGEEQIELIVSVVQ